MKQSTLVLAGLVAFVGLMAGLIFLSTREPAAPARKLVQLDDLPKNGQKKPANHEPIPPPQKLGPPKLAPDRSEQSAEARRLVKKAIDAQGGEAALAKTLVGWVKGKHLVHVPMKPVLQESFTWHFHKPDRYRWTFTPVDAPKFERVVIFNKQDAWEKTDEVRRLPPELAEMEAYMGDIMPLVLLLKDDSFRLKEVVPSGAKDKGGPRVKVSRGSMPEVTLHFNEDTGLLEKLEITSQPPGAKEPATAVVSLSEYKQVQGVLMPAESRLRINGRLVEEFRYDDWQFQESLPADTFARPD